MFIKKLKIYNFRNILNKEYNFNSKVNIFYGNNGVGKTSILESINYISSGKSFRKGNYKNLINYNTYDLTVYLEYINNNNNNKTLSVNKNKNGKWTGKINHTKTHKLVDITNIFPVVSIDPEVYSLIDFGPVYRRNYLDWLVFHVKHDYVVLWKKVYRCIKQLNILYKNKTINELQVWEEGFVKYSKELNLIRKKIFNEVRFNIIDLSNYMQDNIGDLCVEYKQGWPEGNTLEEQVKIDRSKNLLYGRLLHGPHKMDIKIKTNNLQASQVLSRGQKKILSIAFYMAYIKFLNTKGVNPILCLDDFDAELDSEKLHKAALFFEEQKSQIFITSVQKDNIVSAFPDADLFHVKHFT